MFRNKKAPGQVSAVPPPQKCNMRWMVLMPERKVPTVKENESMKKKVTEQNAPRSTENQCQRHGHEISDKSTELYMRLVS